MQTWRDCGLRIADCGGAWIVLLVLALVAPPGAAAADIEVRASVDRNQVAIGQPVVLTVEISGTQNAPVPDLGDVSGLQAQYMGPSTQVTIVNGQMSSNVSHSFRLTPQRTGSLRVGPITLDWQGQKYSAGEIRIEVSAGRPPRRGGAAGTQDLRLLLSLAKNEAYVGEQLPLEVKLLVGNARVDDLQFPQIVADGAVVDKLPQPSRGSQVVGGRRFDVLTFPTKLTAIRPGEVRLSGTMGMSLVVPRGRRRGDPFFDRFFGDAFADKRTVNVEADPLTMTVRPLPAEGRPAGFSGAVGQFDFTLEAKPTELRAGDPVTLRMRISGAGDLSRVSAPSIPVGDNLRAYDPVAVKEEENERTRVFEQVVIPREADVTQLPAVTFSFFDPAAGRYRSITRGPIALRVTPGTAAEEPRIVGGQIAAPQRPRVEELGRDIVYIKDTPGTFRRRGAGFQRSAWFAALLVAPPLGVAVLFVFLRRRDRLAADPRLARYRQAGREARRSLQALAGEEAGTGFYDRLGGAVQEYLGAKLDLPPGAVERQRVLDQLGRNGSSEAVRASVESLFTLIEQARYAPAGEGAAERERALGLAREIVDRLERGRAGGRARTAGALLALLLLPPAVALRAAEEPRTLEPNAAFFQGNIAYQEGRYDDAIAQYENVLAGGLESGALYFNLANAEFKSGRLGLAVLGYERARRMLPRDPDVRANLRYALEQAGVEGAERPLWKRILFPLAGWLATGELAAVFCVLWIVLWGALALGVAVPRLRLAARRGAWVFGVLLLVVGSSFAVRAWETELARTAVVVAAGETPVRFEPTDTGTEHFRAREAERLRVDGESDGWYRVERSDGLRGWLPRAAVETLRGRSGPSNED